MNKTKIVILIAFSLSSCNLNEQGSEASSSSSESIAFSSVYSETESSMDTSEANTSEISTSSSFSLSSKNIPPSSRPSPFQSQSTVYYTVTIYQCYWISDLESYGNPRRDFRVKVEAGQPLYSTVDERHALLDRCSIVYYPNGGAYSVNGFYSDEACTRFINYSYYPINHDMNAYYFCTG